MHSWWFDLCEAENAMDVGGICDRLYLVGLVLLKRWVFEVRGIIGQWF